MIRYAVRTRQIVDLLGEIRRGTLILSPHFQRNLVWREIHKSDFIETILMGLPFPQIFIAKGTLDVTTMINTSSVVDGQQRMNAILDYTMGKFSSAGKYFDDLSISEKEEFLKYEVAVIDLDLRDNDPQIVDIFQRLNRTFYSLSTIEKFSTEYASSEFMLVAKFLTKELRVLSGVDDLGESVFADPNVTDEFLAWSRTRQVNHFQDLVLNSGVFTGYEISRMVHLMYTLNLMATFIGGFYNRNEQARQMLETYSERFDDKDVMVGVFDQTAAVLSRFKFPKKSMWLAKANFFSIFTAVAGRIRNGDAIDIKSTSQLMARFEEKLPPEFALAAKEAVNNKQERMVRDRFLNQVIVTS